MADMRDDVEKKGRKEETVNSEGGWWRQWRKIETKNEKKIETKKEKY